MIPLISAALAGAIAEECIATAAEPAPSWYVGDQQQQDFLLNYFALSTSFSPLHGVLPNEPGHGAISLEASIIPPLGCNRRLVLDRSKTEDTNMAPVLPRPRMSFTLPKLGPIALYGGLGYVPPVTVFGTRNVIVSGEAGLGIPLENGLGFGARYHFTLLKTIAEIATPFSEDEEAYLDYYTGSTFGVDAMAGYRVGLVEPYLAIGFTDASTYFWIGDDGIVSNNSEPFFGLTASAGAALRWKRVDAAAEFYAAAGLVYTGRFRIGVAI